MLLQEIRFKNNLNGNPRKILVIYSMPSSIDVDKKNWLWPERIIELGFQDAISYMKPGDVVLPTIYNWLPYSKLIKQLMG
jgi:hypothetical protein